MKLAEYTIKVDYTDRGQTTSISSTVWNETCIDTLSFEFNSVEKRAKTRRFFWSTTFETNKMKEKSAKRCDLK